MTQIANIKEAITRMLTNKTSNVISLSGSWGGVGKSYFWHEYITNNVLQASISRKKYSYVSLFGIDSLEQLKSTIFERTVPIDKAGEDVSFKLYCSNRGQTTFTKRLNLDVSILWLAPPHSRDTIFILLYTELDLFV